MSDTIIQSMMDLKEKIQSTKDRESQSTGKLKLLTKQLKDQAGIKVEEGDKTLKRMEKQIKKLQDELNEKGGDILERMEKEK